MNRVPEVLIVSHYLDSPGGVANFVAMLIKNFSDEINCEHFPIGPEIDKKTKIRRVRCSIFDNVKLFLKCYRFRYDCVHLNPSLNTKSLLRDGLFMLILSILRYKHVVVFFHGWEKKTEKRIRKSYILKLLFSSIFGKAALILVLADNFRHSLCQMGVATGHVRTVTTMFDPDIFGVICPKEGGEGKTLLFMSRFVKEKGVYELLKAFQLVSSSFKDARLILAGDGPERENIKNWIDSQGLSDCVQVPGYVRGKTKGEMLKSANMFVFPTYYGEGCPVSLLEAMAAGLPVITTPVGGIPDIVTNGLNGILLDQVTPQAIATAIKHLFQDESLSSQMGNNNQVQAWNNYEASIVTRKIESFYVQLMSSS